MRKRIKKGVGALLAASLAAGMLVALPAAANAVDSAQPPAKFDLREKGVVTPVKIQNPWQTCWAFGGIAAAESSILSSMGMTNAEYKQLYGEDFDLSEKHLTWFASNPITASVDSTQVGEGLHLIGKEGDVNAVYDNGGFDILITTLFSAGVGPVYERSFPYQGKEGLTERQYLAKYPDKAAEPARSNFVARTTLTYDQAVERKDDPQSPAKATIDQLVSYGYLAYADLTGEKAVEKLTTAYTKAYAERMSDTNCYPKYDDWSIAELAKDGSPNRNVSAGFTLVDANTLPSLMVKDKDKHWAGINEEGVQAVKSELMKGRAVSAAFKADQAAPGESISKNGYMNTETWAHYTYKDVMPSHAICIVGWDDNYSASNFVAAHQPPGDGAWIVKNSWGSETDYVDTGYGNHIGESKWGVKNDEGKHTGYFYISYYDKTLNWCESMSFDTDLFDKGEAMSVWAYDYMPSTLNFMEDTTDQSETLMKTANVFTNDMGTGAQINAVSTRTAQPNATVTYSMYLLGEDAANPEDGTLLGTKTATYDYAGFHREALDGSIILKDGERLGIVAEETVTSDGKKLYEYINNAAKSEAAARAEGETEYYVAVVNEGESFIYTDGAWSDWSTYEPRTKVSDKYAIDNFSIKAYATPTSVDPDKVSMYRLYNPNSGEHFYTADYAEKTHLVSLGWQDEGTGWTAPQKSDTPVHRLYNANGGEHHYTMSAEEKDSLVAVGWQYEGIGWYSDDAQTTPLLREYNPNQFSNNHNYTTDRGEHDYLVSIGWRDEGYAWYGL